MCRRRQQCVKAFDLSQLGAWVTGVLAERTMLWSSLFRVDTDGSSTPFWAQRVFVEGPSAV